MSDIPEHVLAVIDRHYRPGALRDLLLLHSRHVRDRALAAARCVPFLNPDLAFIAEAAMLHDVGIYLTHAPGIGCKGELPYICHGYLGREILDGEGLPRHALVCERHTGTGLSVEDIDARKLPLPRRDMRPRTIEEKVICYADRFYSKSRPERVRTAEQVEAKLAKFGPDKVRTFRHWHRLFSR